MSGPTHRWGPDDRRGALNQLGSSTVRRALEVVTEGRTISLAAPLSSRSLAASNRRPLLHFWTRTGADYDSGTRNEQDGMGFADDYVVLATHGTTHLDALCHVWSDGLMYGGVPRHRVTNSGAAELGIEHVGPIVTRALVIDGRTPPGTAPTPITADRLDRLLSAVAADPQPGDALLIRTGWRESVLTHGRSAADAGCGLDRGCASLIASLDPVLVGADNPAVEVVGHADPEQSTLHVALLRDRGIYLLELLDLDELVDGGFATAMLVLNPIPITGGSGGPCSPVALV